MQQERENFMWGSTGRNLLGVMVVKQVRDQGGREGGRLALLPAINNTYCGNSFAVSAAQPHSPTACAVLTHLGRPSRRPKL